MLYIYGDSHAKFNFNNLFIKISNLHRFAITMFRIGRDKKIINFKKEHNGKDNIFVLCYGEIDCRCHINRQVQLGKNYQDVCKELVDNYFSTINENITEYKHIIICSITPPACQKDYAKIHGPITHEYPFVGTDEERVQYTNYMNKLIENKCMEYNYKYFSYTDYYSREDGTLKFELSDKNVHIGNNIFLLEKFTLFLENLQ